MEDRADVGCLAGTPSWRDDELLIEPGLACLTEHLGHRAQEPKIRNALHDEIVLTNKQRLAPREPQRRLQCEPSVLVRGCPVLVDSGITRFYLLSDIDVVEACKIDHERQVRRVDRWFVLA